VGIIEWVTNTKPLKEFLQNSLEEGEKKTYDKAPQMQVEWLRKRYGGDRNYKDMYK
jgi:hypothetical protein